MNFEWLTRKKTIARAEAEVRSATRRADFWQNAALKKEKARAKEKKMRVCEICRAKLGKHLKTQDFHFELNAKLAVFERKRKGVAA